MCLRCKPPSQGSLLMHCAPILSKTTRFPWIPFCLIDVPWLSHLWVLTSLQQQFYTLCNGGQYFFLLCLMTKQELMSWRVTSDITSAWFWIPPGSSLGALWTPSSLMIRIMFGICVCMCVIFLCPLLCTLVIAFFVPPLFPGWRKVANGGAEAKNGRREKSSGKGSQESYQSPARCSTEQKGWKQAQTLFCNNPKIILEFFVL